MYLYVTKKYKESLKSDSSINNVIKVFTENYSTVNKDFNRDEDADMLLFQYGVYDWGDGKNLEIDFVRQLLRNDNIIQIHITIKIPYTEKLSNIDSYEEWYNSSTLDISIDSWRNKIQSMPIFETIDSMKYESTAPMQIFVTYLLDGEEKTDYFYADEIVRLQENIEIIAKNTTNILTNS